MMQTEDDFSKRLHHYKYLLAIVFGLIHGLGFSNYLRALILNEESLAGPLFSFNLGIEAGQLLIVSCFILLGILMMGRFKVRSREWNLVFSGAGLGVSIILMIERMPL
jgi:hypothetical protein